MDVKSQKTKSPRKTNSTTTRAADRSLSREAILAEALRLIDKGGLKAMTMRGLGRALGIEAMSIYYYFKNRDELLDGIVEAVMHEVTRHAKASRKADENWEETARRIISAYRAAGKKHPSAFQLFARRPLRTNAAVAQGKELMGAFLDLGLDNTRAIVAYRAISCFAAGFVLLETSKGNPAFTTGNFNIEFEGGLDVILGGVKATLPNVKSSRVRKK